MEEPARIIGRKLGRTCTVFFRSDIVLPSSSWGAAVTAVAAMLVGVIHHVQVACPVGGEAAQRSFYTGALGWEELEKPPLLQRRGGCWFRVPGVGGPDGELHVGVEEDFRPALKAHPAFVVDLDRTAVQLLNAGYLVDWADEAEIPGRRRFHSRDGAGNRIEFLEG